MSLRVFAAVVLVACVAGCENGETSRLNNPNTPYLAASSSSAASQGTSGYDPISYWDGDGVAGAPSVQIHLSEERAYFYKGDQLVGVSQISTGREGHDTPPGNYKIIQKDPNHASSLYGDYVDAAGNIVQKDVDWVKTPNLPAPFSRAHRCLISCASLVEWECTKAISPGTLPRTVASGCPVKWRWLSLAMSHSAPR